MTPALSLYLDVLRFTAAFTVFLSHYAPAHRSGGLFWQVAGYGRASVLAFFVLSGFVIAWVSQGKEANLQEYAISRIARLYSVIIPAFIMTITLDSIGMTLYPAIYQYSSGGFDTDNSVINYLLSFFFLGQSWTLKVSPGSNLPFWSLNHEAWYYIMFACIIFFSGKQRVFLLLIAALLAGPKVLLLFPIWLMGVAAWHARELIPQRLGPVLVLGAIGSFIGLEMIGGHRLFAEPHALWLPLDFSAYDYVVGVIVAVLICGMARSRLPMPGKKLTGAVHALAGTTFGLYLFHFPLLNFFGSVLPGEPASLLHRVLLFSLTLGTALGIAALVEKRKSALKRFLYSALNVVDPIIRGTVMNNPKRRFTG
ncbi:MAG: acyltransferase family protein [Alphaproteobacteria bacterium]